MHGISGPYHLLLCDETLSVLRDPDLLTPGRLEYRDGKPLRRSPQTFIVQVTVQPASQRDLMMVPEGDRYSEVLNVYQQIFDQNRPLQTQDKVLREGKIYVVQAANFWGQHVEARMVRQDAGALDPSQFLPLPLVPMAAAQ